MNTSIVSGLRPTCRHARFRSRVSFQNTRRPFHPSANRRQATISQSAQDVRIKRPFFTWGRFTRYAFFGLISYRTLSEVLNRLFDGIDLEDEDDAAAEKSKEKKEHDGSGDAVVLESDLDEDDEEVFLIPLQYPKKLPKSFYRRSDPEWLEFTKLSRDGPRQQAVRKELVDRVTDTVARHPLMQRRLGENVKWTRFWLDFHFPDSPPPEYSRHVLEIADEYIGFSTQIIPHSDYVKIQHILWPKAIFNAAYESLTLLYQLQCVRVKTALGIELSTLEKHVHRTLVMFRQQQQMAQQLSGEGAAGQVRQGKEEKLGPSESTPAADQTPKRDFPQQEANTDTSGNGGFTIKINVPKPTVPLDFQLTSRFFMNSLASRWTQSRTDFMPDGCCYLLGNIEVTGSRSKCKLEVSAAYNPKQAKFLFVTSKPKHFWDLQQSAKGGP